MGNRVVVLHEGYGCDTGCCGHVVYLNNHSQGFEFAHPYGEDFRVWAEDLVREAGCDPSDLDWNNCEVYDD